MIEEIPKDKQQPWVVTPGQKAPELSVIGKLHRMYSYVLYWHTEPLNPSIPSLPFSEYAYLRRLVISLVFSLSSWNAHNVLYEVQVEQCQCFQWINELEVPEDIEGGVAEKDFGVTVVFFEIEGWLASAVVAGCSCLDASHELVLSEYDSRFPLTHRVKLRSNRREKYNSESSFLGGFFAACWEHVSCDYRVLGEITTHFRSKV